MQGLILASFGTGILTIAFVAVAVLLICLILLQKNRGAGLSGALGGVGGHTAFGTKTGDFLTWVTVGLTSLFLLLSIIGNYVFEQSKMPGRVVPANPSAPTGAVPIESTPPAGQTNSPPIKVQTIPVQPGSGGAGAPSSSVPLTPIPAPTPAGQKPAGPPPVSPPGK